MAKKTPQRKKAKQRPRAPKPATPDPLHALSDDQRVSIYHRLIGDPVVRRRAQEIAEELLHDVTVEEVARQVSREVAGADIDEVYAHSGATAFGYVDPYEYACEYLDGLVKPFLDGLRVRVDQGRVEGGAGQGAGAEGRAGWGGRRGGREGGRS